MGVIQGTINQALGTVAAGAVAAKKFAAGKEAELMTAIENEPKLAEQIKVSEQELEAGQQKMEQIKTGRDEKGKIRKKDDVNKDIEMQQLAINTLQGKIKAMSMQRERYAKVLGGQK